MVTTKKKASGNNLPTTSKSGFAIAAEAASLTPQKGKSAVENRYRNLITGKNAKTSFTGSVDIDAAFEKTEATENRWDYGLGIKQHSQCEHAIWIEPHSGGSTGEVKTMLAKLEWLEKKLALKPFAKLRDLTDEARRQGVKPFIWLSSGPVSIRPGSREAKMLSEQGMDLPRSYVEV